MFDIQRIDPAEAVTRLRVAVELSRGFLGLDPVTQNDALLIRALAELDAQVFACGTTIVGYLPNRDNPRQATISSTSGDPAVVAEFTGFLHRYRRCTSFLATAEPDATPARALLGCGFEEVGRMPGHVFRSGHYRDVAVYFAPWEIACGR
jgi:hypothetical protein